MKDIPYVQAFRDHRGRRRFYYRRAGWPRRRLPDPKDGVAAFMEAYRAAEEKKPLRGPGEGTLAHVITLYKRSRYWRELKPSSQETYGWILDFLEQRPSILIPVSQIRRRMVVALADEVGEKTPGKANMLLAVMGRLMEIAVLHEYRDDNPCYRLGRWTLGEHRAWTEEEQRQFETRWARGTIQRRAYELALGTGQRRSDLSAMTWSDIQQGVIHVVQQKTGAKVWVPIHSSLAEELRLTSREHVSILTTVRERGFSADYLGEWFAAAIDAAGLPEECVLHGLRKSAAARLASVGCTAHEIMAITGHKSLAEVERYTRDAQMGKLAKAAILKLERGVDI